MNTTHFTTLISAEQLANLMATQRDNTVIFDTRFKLDDTEYGRRAYDEGHIAGAHYLHLDHDLSSPITADSGRHPLPNIEAFAHRMRQLGVSSETQVIVYDDAGGMFAARCWWLLKWLGHEQVAVLDGGYPQWLSSSGATDAAAPAQPMPSNFQPVVQPHMVLSSEQVQHALRDSSILLCDARAPERYRGDVEPMDKVAGHVPGAINLPFANNLTDCKCFKAADQLRSLYGNLDGEVVHMCGSGVTACHNLLAAAAAGLPIPKLYAGSWSEWITDPTRPVAKGPAVL